MAERRATEQPGAERVFHLRRLPWTGHARYATPDGRFTVEQGANGAGDWTIYGDERLLIAAGLNRPFRTLREARAYLHGSMYSWPHGWLHQSDDEIETVYQQALYERVST